ncbi:carbohydrate binding domain-containing protein [Desulfovibrio sp. JY]|nr:carbohydrate binding domain-containing protein [Desulfovibrio sp. JY]
MSIPSLTPLSTPPGRTADDFDDAMPQTLTEVDNMVDQLNEIVDAINPILPALDEVPTQSATASQAADTATDAAAVSIAKAAEAAASSALAGTAKTDAEAARDEASSLRDEVAALASNASAGGISAAIGTAAGDLVYYPEAGVPQRLGVGSEGQVLRVVGGLPFWEDAPVSVSLEPTHITNAGFGVWSNGTLESAYSSVDLLGGTGNFETDEDVASWITGNSAAITRDTENAKFGSSCLKITNNGATNGYKSISINTVSGHVYQVVAYAKRGTCNIAYVWVGTSVANYDIFQMSTASTGYERLECTFEATSSTTYITCENYSTSAGTAYYDSISVYDMGPNLVTNGTFNSDTTGWTAGNGAVLASVSGGVSGNCLRITNSGATNGYATQVFSGLTVGKLYKFSGSAKKGTANAIFYLSSLGAGIGYDEISGSSLYDASGSFSRFTCLFEAKSENLYVACINAAASGGVGYYDSITLTEVTVGCVDYNTKALDLWNKDPTTKCWRETNNVKSGALYALRVYGGKVYWSDGQRVATPEFCRRYAGAGPVVIGVWVHSSVANKARIGIIDSAGESWSEYHPGDGLYHYLQVTRTPAAGITSFQAVADSGTDAEAVFSQPQLQRGNLLDEGSFVGRTREIIRFPSIQSTKYTWAGKTAQAFTAHSIAVDSNCRLPRGIKSVIITFVADDNGSATATLSNRVAIVNSTGPSGEAVNGINNADYGVIVNAGSSAYNFANGAIPVNADGQIFVGFSSSGTNTMYFSLKYGGVEI